ncbi:uncharacterized protein FA14DRAFT_161790 [Meira miltonrushii]|uniref:SP-RING-type domain-containing protein n=1 Tax=Meira miltonrushii TaxID=1280837 RepID=A0A316V9Y1_9BASI|nr:uncharacterized protein FA14DRAFT_161790 [Meira miltonrushii]PWN34377.1 hypothetical protein FA14DRAFT_161790 [Meira miltonrushii]
MASTSARPATAATFQPVDNDYLKSSISRLTIPQIKPLLREVSAIAGVALPAVNVRKNVLVDSLNIMMLHLLTENRQHQYMAALRAIEAALGGSLTFGPTTSHNRPSYQPYHPLPPRPQPQPARPPPQQHYNTIGQNPNANYYSDYHNAVQQQRAAQVAPKAGTFKESPFYTLKEWIHPSVMCAQVPEHARPAGSAKISFNLTGAQCNELANASSRKEARLFCTSFAASRASEARHPAPVEFPINCEVRVNRVQLSVNLRGRKGPAKVLPPNLNKDKKLNLQTGRNEVELTYVHTYQPYILTIGICETVSSEELVEKVKKESVKSKETVLKEMKRAADDDDIEVGDVTVNLKCPLSYMRLKTPCRSSVCTHIQCFDALSFYSINEQTPSWQCPICSRTIDPKQIFVDGYVLDILQRVPDSEESVQIDSEGRWKTPNNKYRSDDVAANGAATGSAANTPSKTAVAAKEEGTDSPLPPLPRVKGEDEANPRLDIRAGASNEPDTAEGQQRNKKRTIDVVDLDDSPSPPGAVPQEEASEAANSSNGVQRNALNGASIQAAGGSSTTSAGDAIMGQSVDSSSTEPSRPAVIDLTFSDSEDEDQPLRQQMPIVRPMPGRPPVRPPAIPSKPSDVANRTFAAQNGIAPMPLPGPPRLSNGQQPIDRFLIRNQAGPSNGRSSPSSFNDGMMNAHRSSSFTNGTFTLNPFPDWHRISPTLANREVGVARPRSGLPHSASFSNEPTFRSGIFHAPSSPNEPLNPSRSHTQPPSDPINEENAPAPASSQTQDENESVDEAVAGNNVNAGRTPPHTAAEDEDSDPVSRPRKRARVVADAEEEEEEDELDLDPDAGFATPNDRAPSQTNGDHGRSNGNANANDDSNNSPTERLTDRLFDRRPNQAPNRPTSSGSKTGPIAYRNTANDMDDMSDDDFEADERAGFGFN